MVLHTSPLATGPLSLAMGQRLGEIPVAWTAFALLEERPEPPETLHLHCANSLLNTRKGATQRQALWTLVRAAVAVQPEPPALDQAAHEEKEG